MMIDDRLELEGIPINTDLFTYIMSVPYHAE